MHIVMLVAVTLYGWRQPHYMVAGSSTVYGCRQQYIITSKNYCRGAGDLLAFMADRGDDGREIGDTAACPMHAH